MSRVILAVIIAVVACGIASAQPAPICSDIASCSAIIARSTGDVVEAQAMIQMLTHPELGASPRTSQLCADVASCTSIVATREWERAQAFKFMFALAPWPAKTATAPVELVVSGNPIAGAPYSIEASIGASITGAINVNFIVDGVLKRVETIAKFCLFGGDVVCAQGRLGAGQHSIKAQVVRAGTTEWIAEADLIVVEP